MGTINATLQTLVVADRLRDGLSLAGVVLNSPQLTTGDSSIDSNADELRQRCVPPLLANVGYGGRIDAAIDWWSLAEPK